MRQVRNCQVASSVALCLLALCAFLFVGCRDEDTLNTSRPSPESPAADSIMSLDEVWDHVLTRILLSGCPSTSESRYVEALMGTHEREDGSLHHYLHVGSAEEELALASSLAYAGFFAEAVHHYENILAYYPHSEAASRVQTSTDYDKARKYLTHRHPARFSREQEHEILEALWALRPEHFKARFGHEPSQPVRTPLFYHFSPGWSIYIGRERVGLGEMVAERLYSAERFEEQRCLPEAIGELESLLRESGQSPISSYIHMKIGQLSATLGLDDNALSHYRVALRTFPALSFPVITDGRRVTDELIVQWDYNEFEDYAECLTLEETDAELVVPEGGEGYAHSLEFRLLARKKPEQGPTAEAKTGKFLIFYPNAFRDISLEWRTALEDHRRTLLDEIVKLIGEPSKENVEDYMRIADCYIYNGDFTKAEKILEKIESIQSNEDVIFKRLACMVRREMTSPDSSCATSLDALVEFARTRPDSPHAKKLEFLRARLLLSRERPDLAAPILDGLAADRNWMFAQDARFLLDTIETRLLKFDIHECITFDETIPITLTRRNLNSVTFQFEKIAGRPGSDGREDSVEKPSNLSPQFDAFRDAPREKAYVINMDLAPIPTGQKVSEEIHLPLKDPGLYFVTAGIDGLETSFLVERLDISLCAVLFPESSLFLARSASTGTPVSGLEISVRGKLLGITDEDGFIFLPGEVPIPCEVCGKPFHQCSACQRRWRERTKGSSICPPFDILAAGPGICFKAAGQARLDHTFKVNTSRRAPMLYVYTDRPTYKAGQKLFFKGILMQEKEDLSTEFTSRLEPLPRKKVCIEVRNEDSTVFSRDYLTGEEGTFWGECTLPIGLPRCKHELAVSCDGTKASAEFEVRDYRRADFAIRAVPAKGGLNVTAGYSWGGRVGDSMIRCTVGDDAMAAAPDESGRFFLNLEDGQSVTISLERGGEVLAEKTVTFLEPRDDIITAQEPSEETGAQEIAHEKSDISREGRIEESGKSVPHQPRNFAVKIVSSHHVEGGGIDVEISSTKDGGSVLVLVGDTRIYDWRLVELKCGSGRVSFPIKGIYDPGTYITALFLGDDEPHVEKAYAKVFSHLMEVSIQAGKEVCAPGEEVEITLRCADSSGNGAVSQASLAVVDETIFMLEEDKTPDIYEFFHRERPTDSAWMCFGNFSLGQTSVQAETGLPSDRPGLRRVFVEPLTLSSSMLFDRIAGGGFGSRYGGAMAMGGGRASEESVLRSLKWLASNQNADGSWGDSPYEAGRCVFAKTGITGLAVLCYLGAGYTPHSNDTLKIDSGSRKSGEIVSAALKCLMERQTPHGGIDGGTGEAFGNHAIAALAFSEAYGLTGSYRYKTPAQKAIDFIAQKQSSDGGWNAEADINAPGEIVTSMCATLALASARSSKLNVADSCLRRATSFFGRRIPALTGSTPETPEYDHDANLDRAITLLCLTMLDVSSDDLAKLADILVAMPTDSAIRSPLLTYVVTAAFDQFKRFDYSYSRDWSTTIISGIKKGMSKDGCWNLTGDSDSSATAFATSLYCLSLEVYYRYACVFGGMRKREPLAPEPRLRVHFPDTALWVPDLQTGGDGLARILLTVPDAISSLRLTARAVTRDGSVGQDVSWLEVRQDFFINLKSPAFFASGDTAVIRADIHNYTVTPQEVRATLDGEGFELLGERNVRSLVEPGIPGHVSWNISVTSKNQVRLIAKAVTSSHADAMELTVPVHILGREVRRTVVQESNGADTLSIDIPADINVQTAKLCFQVRPLKSNLYHILESLRYLVDYPYG